MDRTERFYRITQLLESRRIVPREVFLEEIGVSLATFKRDIEYLRDRFGVPIVWDIEQRGYRFDGPGGKSPRFELPGLWFNASEAYALLAMQGLLDSVKPRLLAPYIAPFKERIASLLGRGDHALAEVKKRIRLLPQATRSIEVKHFGTISHAVLSRKRLQLTYYHRAQNEETQREVSPQRLVYYRDNWYLDAWCHLRNALRCFALDSIREVSLLGASARKVPESELDEELGGSYGIFNGKPDKVAKLRFTPERARWVAGEIWHPEQKGAFDAQGYYLLEIPYKEDHELVMDILKHGPEVEVLAPAVLRQRVLEMFDKSARQYRSTK